MAISPPPYDGITGTRQIVGKYNFQESIANVDGNARPGQLIVDLETDPPQLYVGNNTGNITFNGTTISTDGAAPGYPTLVNSPGSLGGVEIDYDSETVSHAMWLNGEDGLAIQINRHLEEGQSQ